MRLLGTCMLAVLWALGGVLAADVNMEWAYHDDSDGIDHRVSEKAPGMDSTFLSGGSTNIDTAATVSLYLLTANQFAGDNEEQVYVRWWNGTEEHWVQATWVKNITLGDGEGGAGRFHGQPALSQATIDLWKADVSPEMTRPGDNYYVIQLKTWDDMGVAERYLLREPEGEFGSKNELGQAWTASAKEYHGRDWKVRITEPGGTPPAQEPGKPVEPDEPAEQEDEDEE